MQVIIYELCTEFRRSDRESIGGSKVLIKEKTCKCRPYTPLSMHLLGQVGLCIDLPTAPCWTHAAMSVEILHASIDMIE